MSAIFILQANSILGRWMDRRAGGFGLPGCYFSIGMLGSDVMGYLRDGWRHGYLSRSTMR